LLFTKRRSCPNSYSPVDSLFTSAPGSIASHKNGKAITDADATHYANSYAAPEQLRAGLEFYRAFPANEKFNAAQRSALEVPIVLAGGDKTAGPTLPRMADSLREHGCAEVTIEVIQNSGHFVSEEQPERVADLIEHYASVERK
jgi:pimeloyl-ACP methyl ester carboxylesterase